MYDQLIHLYPLFLPLQAIQPVFISQVGFQLGATLPSIFHAETNCLCGEHQIIPCRQESYPVQIGQLIYQLLQICIIGQLQSQLYNNIPNQQTAMLHSNPIINCNTITQGLNFLVPLLWWNDFVDANRHIQNWQELNLVGASPLDSLYELHIIGEASEVLPSSFTAIIVDAQQSLNTVKLQLSQVEARENGSNGKRSHVGCIWLQEASQLRKEDCDLLLYSPQVKQEVVRLYEIAQESWVLISPELYRWIWLKQAQRKTNERKNQLLAIPTFISENERKSYKSINFNNKHHLQLFFKSFSGFSFIFQGQIDQNATIGELVKYMLDGVYRLLGGSKIAKGTATVDMLLRFHNVHQTFYDFKQEPVTQQLPWAHFSQFNSLVVSTPYARQIHIFAIDQAPASEMQPQGKCKADSEWDKTTKKRKVSLIPQGLDNKDIMKDLVKMQKEVQGLGKQIKKEGVQRGFEQEMQREQQEMQRVFKKEVKRESKQEVQKEGKQEVQQEGKQPKLVMPSKKIQRLAHPLWSYRAETEQLAKQAEARSAVPLIPVPYQNQQLTHLRDSEMAIVLPKITNNLIQDEQGNLWQQKVSQAAGKKGKSKQAPSEATRLQLQLLAQQVLSARFGDMQEANQNGQPQSEPGTTRNDFGHGMDFEESEH